STPTPSRCGPEAPTAARNPTMVSAVFHTPFDPQTRHGAAPAADHADEPPRPALQRPPARRFDVRALALRVLPPVCGIALLVAVWGLLTLGSTSFPTPAQTFASALQLFADPFYRKGPNDQGIGWNILFSLERVGLGFGLAALVGIPLGFLVGRFEFLGRMVSPLISLLRPVSPL